MMMTSGISEFSDYSSMPTLATSRLPCDFPPYINVKTEMDFGFGHGHHQSNSPSYPYSLQNSPHGLSSCMYAPASPCLAPPTSPDHCVSIASSIKENSAFRNSPACRRRLDFNHNAFLDGGKVGPVAVAKRNERERNRVKLINMTFQTLRQHLPLNSSGSKGKSRKLSKVQTLRSAIEYIRQLQDMVHNKQQLKQQQQQQQQQLHQLPQREHHNIRQEVANKAAVFCGTESRTLYAGSDIDMTSPNRMDELKSFSGTQKNCGTLSKSNSLEEFNENCVKSPLSQREILSSSCATSSSYLSPYSDASSSATPEEDEFIDFDDWF